MTVAWKVVEVTEDHVAVEFTDNVSNNYVHKFSASEATDNNGDINTSFLKHNIINMSRSLDKQWKSPKIAGPKASEIISMKGDSDSIPPSLVDKGNVTRLGPVTFINRPAGGGNPNG